MRKAEQSKKLDLERIVFIGRTFSEYAHMFSLSAEELRGKKILDCPGGACSFTAVGNKAGLDITACDIAYDHSSEDLKSKGLRDVIHAMEHVRRGQKNYKWNYFKNVEHLKSHRLSALQDCAKDMKNHSEKYIPVTLPDLPFKNEAFDIVLSAHFLFIYSDRLDYQFHLDTIQELMRVAGEEVRIFPVVDLEGKRYEHLDSLVRFFTEKGFTVMEKQVSYEFQENANSMLIVKK